MPRLTLAAAYIRRELYTCKCIRVRQHKTRNPRINGSRPTGPMMTWFILMPRCGLINCEARFATLQNKWLE